MPVGTRPQPPADSVRVALSGTTRGHRFVNVFWLKLTKSAAVTVNDLSTIATGIDTTYNTSIRTATTGDVTLTAIDLKYYKGDGTILEYTKTVARSGASGTSVNDAACCFVVNWIISSLYRGGHPRSYMPGVDGTTVSNGSDISSGMVSTFATAAEAFRNAINAITSTNVTAVVMGTVRFQQADTWLSPPAFFAYTSSRVRSKIGTQRRRILN